MTTLASFALNHMTVPGLSYDAVIGMAQRLGCVGVEFRNDLAGPLFGGDTPEHVREKLDAAGLRLLALAEVKAFNDWSDDKRREAEALIAIAAAAGAEAVALIPRNDGFGRGNGERQANLRMALRALHPMLKDAGLLGLVEPLGFSSCALRFKADAVEAINSLNAADTFRLVHDTFHHHVAGETRIFPEMTGMVHVSGVVDQDVATAEMQDAHRVLVDGRDRLGNIDQIAALVSAGYRGPISMEAFAPEIHALTRVEAALEQSFEFIRSQISAGVA